MTTETDVALPGQDHQYHITIPMPHLAEVLSPSRVAAKVELRKLLLDALLHPIASSPLAELAGQGRRILIIVDDVTRTTPIREVVPILLEHLAAAGCTDDCITFALALGTHRRMTQREIDLKLGQDVSRRFPVINTPAQQVDAFVPSGVTWDGVPIEVHQAVREADLVIGVGSVVPHTEAGWSGGCKIVLPGMCSERTVMVNHRLAATYPGNALGQADTPIRRHMEALVASIGLGFILNLVVTPDGDVVGAFAGHYVAAQRAAVQVARQVFSVPYYERADIVVSNAYPAEIDFWQASKGIWSGELLVKPNGTVILHAPCPEGIGPHPDYLAFLQRDPADLARGLETGAIADQSAAGLALPITRMLDHMTLVIVSPGLPDEQFPGGPVRHYTNLGEALAASIAQAGATCRISVLTHGGYTFPVPAAIQALTSSESAMPVIHTHVHS